MLIMESYYNAQTGDFAPSIVHARDHFPAIKEGDTLILVEIEVYRTGIPQEVGDCKFCEHGTIELVIDTVETHNIKAISESESATLPFTLNVHPNKLFPIDTAERGNNVWITYKPERMMP